MTPSFVDQEKASMIAHVVAIPATPIDVTKYRRRTSDTARGV
jgi:hypothetical protein